MDGKVQRATDALARTIASCLPQGKKVSVTQMRPGWWVDDLLGDRVNVYLFQVAEDRVAANNVMPSSPVTLSYLVTFYGRGAGANAEAVIERLIRSASLDTPVAAGAVTNVAAASGLVARVRRTGAEEMATIWGMFRRKYALSLVIDVKGTVLA